MAATAAMTLRRVVPKLLLAVLLATVAGWGGGLIWFMHATRRSPEPPPLHADGIVALTGGAGRVDLALRLLALGRADRLLLSGIGAHTDLATLGRLAGIDTAPLTERITLGRYAASTRGNGIETAAWAERNRIASLIVVTAAYHMPRALVELHQDIPDVRLFPVPVAPADEHGGIEKTVSLRLEATEYTKYLLSASGLSGWLPHRELDASSG